MGTASGLAKEIGPEEKLDGVLGMTGFPAQSVFSIASDTELQMYLVIEHVQLQRGQQRVTSALHL